MRVEQSPVPRLAPPRDPQRRFPRFRPRNARVVCSPRNLWKALGLKTSAGATLQDLSQGGAQVVTTRGLRAGTTVDLSIEFARADSDLRAEAVVRWCRRDTMSLEPRWHTGLVFRRMSALHEERLRELDALHGG